MTVRPYNPGDPRDKAWNSEVSATAMEFIQRFLRNQDGHCATARDIRNGFKQANPILCDDAIARSADNRQLKWQHCVDSALQNLKNRRVLTGGRDGRVPGKWCLASESGEPPSGDIYPDVSDDVYPVQERSQSESQTVMSSVEERGDSTAKSLLEQILSLSPKGFEVLVGEYLKAKGFAKVEVTGTSHDGGIDGRCEIPFIDVTVAFQAKRYKTGNTVGISPVQRLNGSLGNTYDRGVFITTSSFSPSAKSWIEEEGIQKITLVDGQELVTQMMELELGVETVPVVRHEIDKRFFDELGNRS